MLEMDEEMACSRLVTSFRFSVRPQFLHFLYIRGSQPIRDKCTVQWEEGRKDTMHADDGTKDAGKWTFFE